MEHQEMLNEVDYLKGNINRICVTHDMVECWNMYEYAKKRLERIHDYNVARIFELKEKGGKL